MRPVTSARPARLAVVAASIALLGMVIATASASAAPTVNQGRHFGASHGGPAKPVSNLIDHGGLVLPTSKTYLIFWGSSWSSDPDLQTAMPILFAGFNGSSYLGIAEQYMHSVPISSHYLGSFTDTSAPPSHAPTASALGTEVAHLTTPDPNALYVVFTSNLPKVSYCAWHDKTIAGNVPIEVAYIPLQPTGCGVGTDIGAGNGYTATTVAAADSAAHEFMETITDPQLNAWYDKGGSEVADKCEYNYPSVVTLSNSSKWQIQSEWSNANAACVEFLP